MKLNRIKAVLTDKGISQTWLAKQLDKSFSMVNAYACNRIQPKFGYVTADCGNTSSGFKRIDNGQKSNVNSVCRYQLFLHYNF